MANQDVNSNMWGSGIVSTFQEGDYVGYGTSAKKSMVDSITINATHNHTVSGTTGASSGNTANSSALTSGSATQSGTNSNTGGGGTHNNLQPYITVFMWKRIA